MVVNKNSDLSDDVTIKLLHEMEHGTYAHEKMLPPESEIARQMGVSRPVVRESLSRLEREGFVSRKHGVGTVINHHVLSLTTRMDMEKDFLDLVRDAGYEPGTVDIAVKEIPAPAGVASRLNVKEEYPLILVERVITADGDPVIFNRDYFSKELITADTYTEEDLKTPVFLFLRDFCGKDVHLDLTEVQAGVADDSLAEKMKISAGDPVIMMNEVGYDILGVPLTCCFQVYVGDKIQHMMLQKRI